MSAPVDERHVRVGTVTDFSENVFRIVELPDGRSIGVVRTAEGFYAMANKCPHQGANLCEGRVGGTMERSDPHDFRFSTEVLVATCPWHRWEFELATGNSYGPVSGRKVVTFEVLVHDDEVYIAPRRRKANA